MTLAFSTRLVPHHTVFSAASVRLKLVGTALTSLALVMVLATPVASAQGSAFAELEAEEGKRLEACLDKIATDPENAYEDALGWLYEGRRPAARQCAALALIAMGQLGEGAVRLEAIARAPDGGSLEDRAHYLNLAGQTWLKAEQAEAALRTFDSAASLDRSLDVRAGRAAALVSLERWAEAEGVLDSLIKDTPTAATHRQRALARLNRGNLEGAQTDVDAALNLDPRDVDSLVVRGRLREAQRLKATTN